MDKLIRTSRDLKPIAKHKVDLRKRSLFWEQLGCSELPTMWTVMLAQWLEYSLMKYMHL